jgi:putative ABC transport system permease protein
LNYLDWVKQSTEFDDLAAYRYGGFTLTGREYPEQLGTLIVTANLFRTLGVEPLIGRTFTEEEVKNGERVVVLGHQFWQNRLGGDRSIVGSALTLNGTSVTVVGVMPPHFAFPDGQSAIETYSPLIFNQGDLSGRRSHTLTVVGRLKPDASIESAAANLGTIARSIAGQDQTSNPDVKIIAAHEQLVSEVRLGLFVLLGTVGIVLLIACANVANLLLVRSSARRREMAVRTSLGAGRARVIRQLLTESLMLSVAGGIAGTALARLALE